MADTGIVDRWNTPSPHPNRLFCPECFGVLDETWDYEAQVYQICRRCGWNNRPTVDEWIERLRAEYQNHPYKYEEWEREIIEETLSAFDNDE